MLQPERENDAKRPLWQVRRNVSSTGARKNPFVALDPSRRVNDDSGKIPILIRNQSIRLGAAAVGKALQGAGATTVAYGRRVYNMPSTTRTDLFITKRDLKRKVTRSEYVELKKRHRFMPSNDRRQQRWVEKSVRAQGQHTTTPKARGRTIMRSGTVMIGVGRAIPTMAVGWIVADATMRSIEGEPIQEQGWGTLVAQTHGDFVSSTASGAKTALTLGTIGYGIAQDVLEIIL